MSTGVHWSFTRATDYITATAGKLAETSRIQKNWSRRIMFVLTEINRWMWRIHICEQENLVGQAMQITAELQQVRDDCAAYTGIRGPWGGSNLGFLVQRAGLKKSRPAKGSEYRVTVLSLSNKIHHSFSQRLSCISQIILTICKTGNEFLKTISTNSTTQWFTCTSQ